MVETNEESELWKRVREHGKARRTSNQEKSLELLRVQYGINVRMLNQATGHYRVGGFDFWPSTGKFYNQKTKEGGRGVFNLIKRLGYAPV